MLFAGGYEEQFIEAGVDLDAEDRTALTDELTALRLPFTVNGRVIVPYQESAQDVIARLQTKLMVLRIHEPSLEDAYVEFLNRSRMEAA